MFDQIVNATSVAHRRRDRGRSVALAV